MAEILDANGGVITTVSTDAGTGDTIIATHQDVQPIIDANIAGQNSGHDGYNRDRNMRHFAEVPHNIVHQWMMDDQLPPSYYFRMGRAEKEAYVRRKMNDPDWAYLRAFWTPGNSRIRHAKAI